MKLTILAEKAYLALPFGSIAASSRVLRIYRDGVLQDDIRVRLDYEAPQFTAYYPLSRYKGQRLTLEISPDMELRDIQTDQADFSEADRYPFRPEWHFTARLGWHNDPNGLVRYVSPVTGKTCYHLFYQYNPYDTVWNNMHWGHAVSSDLLNWERLPIALFPDAEGTMFSGSAIVDKGNRSGLKEGDEDVILLYYTSAGGTNDISRGKDFTQTLAYSTDGGCTFRKYAKNPILPTLAKGNRDPKVVWSEEARCYIMALFLTYEEGYALFRSDDLLHWEMLQTLRLEGDGECPDLYPLCVNGNPDDVKWVFNGAKYYYHVCEWDGQRFRPVQPMQKLNYSPDFYAAQTFSNVPDGRRIGMAWERNIEFPSPAPFSSQMSIPYELTLKKTGDRYFLCALPVKEIAAVCEDGGSCGPFLVGPEREFEMALTKGACDISFSLGDGESGPIQIELFGHRIDVDPQENAVTFGRKDARLRMPFSASGAEKSLRIVADRCSMELFTDGGTSVMTVSAVCDYNLCRLRITAERPVRIENLVVRASRAQGNR